MKTSRSLSRKHLRGFSLAEVLIAIVIIAILTIGSLAVYSSQIAKARDTERRNDVTRIKGLLDTVIGEYGAPPGESVQSRKLKQIDDCKSRAKLVDCFKELQVSTEDDLDNLFADPSQGIQNDRVEGERLYGYLYGSNRNSFKICTMLEDQGSSDLNTKYSGAPDPARSENDKLYCIDNIASPPVTILSMQYNLSFSLRILPEVKMINCTALTILSRGERRLRRW